MPPWGGDIWQCLEPVLVITAAVVLLAGAVKQPTVHRTPLENQNDPVTNVTSAQVEKPCPAVCSSGSAWESSFLRSQGLGNAGLSLRSPVLPASPPPALAMAVIELFPARPGLCAGHAVVTKTCKVLLARQLGRWSAEGGHGVSLEPIPWAAH